MNPWEQKNGIEIICEFEAKIIGEEEEYYLVEFIDYDGSIIESRILKEKFKDLPYKEEIGDHFWVVGYNKNYNAKVDVWPVAEYWDPHFLEDK